MKYLVASLISSLSKTEKLMWSLGFCLPLGMFIVFTAYWFGIRDTWEIDNSAEIMKRCDAVMVAIGESDDKAAEQAFGELNGLLGERTPQLDFLANRFKEVHTAYSLVEIRIKKAHELKVAKELAEADRIAKQAEIESRRLQRDIESTQRRGQVDWDVVDKIRDNWNQLGFRHADSFEQQQGMAIIIVAVQKEVSDPLDLEATLDYIQRNIDSW